MALWYDACTTTHHKSVKKKIVVKIVLFQGSPTKMKNILKLRFLTQYVHTFCLPIFKDVEAEISYTIHSPLSTFK